MHIYIVRHTEYSNPENIYPFHLPVNLSKEGREHAKLLGKWFAQHANKEIPIYSSPIARCVQTSEIIASKTLSHVVIDPRLIESSCPGLQGEKRPKVKAWRIEEDEPTRESRESIRERATAIFEEKMAERKACILVSHGDPTTILYYHLAKKELPKYFWDPNGSHDYISKGTIVDIEIENNKILNITRHTAVKHK